MGDNERSHAFLCFESYYDITLMLDDHEFTRLIRAAMEYCFFGEVKQQFGARDEAMFAFIKRDIDVNNEKYAQTCKKRKQAIDKRWAKEKQNSEENTNDTNVYKSIQMYANDTKEKENEKERENEKEKEIPNGIKSPLSPLDERSSDLRQAVNKWLVYKKEKQQAYKPMGLKQLVTQILSYCDKYGDSAVVDVINRTMANSYQGIGWYWLDKEQQQTKPQAVTVNQQGTSTTDRLIDMIKAGEFSD